MQSGCTAVHIATHIQTKVAEGAERTSPLRPRAVALPPFSALLSFASLLSATLPSPIQSLVIPLSLGTSASMKSSLINTSSSGGSTSTASKQGSALDVPPSEIAKKFGISTDGEFLMHCDCTLSIEENSVSKGHDHGASIFLFSTHLCIEVRRKCCLLSVPSLTYALLFG